MLGAATLDCGTFSACLCCRRRSARSARVGRPQSASCCRATVSLERLTQGWKQSLVQLRMVKANLPQPTQKFGSPAGEDQRSPARLERRIQLPERVEAVDVDVTDRNRIDDEPAQVCSGRVCNRQRALFEIVGVEEGQRPVE